MACRQLGAMTFVTMALLAIGCGSGAAGAVSAGSDDTRPPANKDQPPNSTADRAPSSSDQPPSNADAAPGGAQSGSSGTGGLGSLCQKVCSSAAALGDSCAKLKIGDVDLSKACSGDDACQVPAGTPCLDELTALFNCALDNLGMVCGLDTQSEQGVPACRQAANDFVVCASKQSDATSGTVKNCTPAGDCACGDECQKCVCKADSDASKVAACAEAGSACNP